MAQTSRRSHRAIARGRAFGKQGVDQLLAGVAQSFAIGAGSVLANDVVKVTWRRQRSWAISSRRMPDSNAYQRDPKDRAFLRPFSLVETVVNMELWITSNESFTPDTPLN